MSWSFPPHRLSKPVVGKNQFFSGHRTSVKGNEYVYYFLTAREELKGTKIKKQHKSQKKAIQTKKQPHQGPETEVKLGIGCIDTAVLRVQVICREKKKNR